MRREETAIEHWMARRWAELRGRGLADTGQVTPIEAAQVSLTEPEPLREVEEVQAGVGPDQGAPGPMDLGLRFEKARQGSSISGLIGSSDPRAIGKFLSLNGINGSDPTVRPGRSYVVPTRWDDATDQEEMTGRSLLRQDNARLQNLAEEQAATARQAELLRQGRNIFTGESVGRSSQTKALPPSPKPRRNQIDESPTAKALAGAFGWASGIGPGVARGGVNTVKGAADGAYFLYRLSDPYDGVRSLPGASAKDQLLGVARGAGDYAGRAFEDPSIVRDDIEAAFSDFRRKQDPFATPVSGTAFGEFQRMRDIGEHNGELAFNVGSTVVGGEFVRGAAGLGATAKAATAAEKAFLAANPGVAARFALPYKGMSHHIIQRGAKLPKWLGGGSYPDWLIESEFNKIRHEGLTTRDLYRNHIGVDDSYNGGRVGRRYGSTPWSGRRDLGWDRYGGLDRFNYGTSPYTKAVIGPVLLGGPLVDQFEGTAP